MPVQFRCSLCRKKLKVSRRKTGTLVNCPNCGGSTLVPTASDMNAELNQLLRSSRSTTVVKAPTKIPKAVKPQPRLEDLPLFEREDFAEMLIQNDVHDVELAEQSVTPGSVESRQRMVEADSVVMSRSTLTMYVIAVVSLLGLAFAAGFLVGSSK